MKAERVACDPSSACETLPMPNALSLRREFLVQMGWGVSALVGAQGASGCRAANAGASAEAATFHPDVEIALRAAPTQAPILPGAPTEVWALRGKVIQGDARCLEDSASPALGPTVRVRVGQRLRVVFTNDIPQETILHWHGLRVPEGADGHPRFAIEQGRQYIYEFVVKGPAGTYWYHAHPDMRTGEQVYRGMAGLFIVSDAHEASLSLPTGAFDAGLVIQDRLFDASNQLRYLVSPMDRMQGLLGDRILVNGTAEPTMRVAAAPYRLRVLNASNSRIYRLAWAHGSPLTVLGTDGGLLEAPLQKSYVMLAPAERVELWADFGRFPLGFETALVSLAFDGMTQAGPMGRSGVAQGAALKILKIKVDRSSSERSRLPERLTAIGRHRLKDAVNSAAPRRIVPTMQHMGFAINGRTFEMNAVAADEHVKLGTLEAWEFDNSAAPGAAGRMGMMGMGPMPHPFHVHCGQFQVLRREGVTHTGYVDEGWKDTLLVMPGEKATMLMRFLDYPGIYLYHCHNLEHEDGGMMRNFAIDA